MRLRFVRFIHPVPPPGTLDDLRPFYTSNPDATFRMELDIDLDVGLVTITDPKSGAKRMAPIHNVACFEPEAEPKEAKAKK